MRYRSLAAAAALVLSALPLAAGDYDPVQLDPVTHQRATLVIVEADGTEVSYTPAELEGYATYALTTATPWRETPARFEGVMLSDVLAAHGLDQADSIVVTAENEYTTTIPRALMQDLPIMLATRVDGQPHSRRARGPIQFMMDMEAHDAHALATESNYVWMAARIEAGS